MEGFPSRVTLYEDGLYRWYYDMDMWHNRYFLKRVACIIGLSLGIPMLFIVAMLLKTLIPLWKAGASQREIEFFIHDDMLVLYVVGGMWVGLLLLFFVIYAIAALVMHGTWRQCFQMDETAVALVQNPETMARLENIGMAVSVASTLVGKGGDGTRLNRSIANARDGGVSAFESVHRVKPMEKYDVVGVRGLVLMNPIYVPKEDYDFVLDFIMERVPEKARR